MSVITDLYQQLFGKDHIQDGNVIDFEEHGRVGGVSTGQGFKFISLIDPNTGEYLGQSTDFEGGQVTVGLTEVEITFTGTTKSILIEADCDNSGYIFIGKNGVTTTTAMAKLEPGASLTIELNDSDNAIYAISDVAGQTIRKLALL